MPEASHSKDRLTSAPTLLRSPTRVVVFGLLAMMGIGMSVSAYDWARPDGLFFYWGILPGAPFVLLAGLALVPRIPLRVTIGACVGGLLAVATSYGALIYASANYAGGGANIGLGLLLLATPVYLPIAMLVGASCGRRIGSHIMTTMIALTLFVSIFLTKGQAEDDMKSERIAISNLTPAVDGREVVMTFKIGLFRFQV